MTQTNQLREDCATDALGTRGLTPDQGDARVGYADRPRTIRTSIEVAAHHDFSTALRHVFSGDRATRAGWNAGGQHVEVQMPDKASRMSVPYLVLKNAQGDLVPWVPSQGDLFATDWALLPRR